jgi:ring-1,2-phenylacetyl-CoA epoxidase subunit PaaE
MSQFHALMVRDVAQETRDAVVVTFDVPQTLRDQYRYTQGQYLTLRTTVNNEDIRRSYSICSSVQDNALRVAIKRVPGGEFSTWANESLKAGDMIDVMAPMGNFNLPLSQDNACHYVGFAAGSGITPLISIIKTTLMTEPNSRFTLFYGNRASSSVIFKEELAAIKDMYLGRFTLAYVLSREPQDIALFNGRIDKEKCEHLLTSWIDINNIDGVFICGPEQMTKDVSDLLQEKGLPKSKIKAELFAASTSVKARERKAHPTQTAQQCDVTLIVDGAHVSFSMEREKESVLDAALRNGVEIGYSCKSGVCSTCRCKVVSGKVDMDANYALEDYEVARGFVLSCQSFPQTDALVIDFDQHE